MNLSISIVSHNSKKDLELLMPSLKEGLSKISSEILLVDNGSGDGSAEFIETNYPEVILTKNSTRCGYGTNHNKNLAKAKGEYVVFMNSDMIMTPGVMAALYEFMTANPDVGICSANVHNRNGTLQYLYKQYPTILDLLLRRFAPSFIQRIFRNRFHHYEMREVAYESAVDVPFISGCFMFCRTSVIRKVSGFDERFFLYFEDVDLCRKVQEHARTMSCPQAKVIHRWERMAHKELKGFIIFIQSAVRYFNKWGYRLY